jgi:hypothetical protein
VVGGGGGRSECEFFDSKLKNLHFKFGFLESDSKNSCCNKRFSLARLAPGMSFVIPNQKTYILNVSFLIRFEKLMAMNNPKRKKHPRRGFETLRMSFSSRRWPNSFPFRLDKPTLANYLVLN